MNRAKFLRNLAGTFAAAVIGSKLEILEPEMLEPDLPGKGGTAFKLFVRKSAFRQGDIIMSSTLQQLYITKEGDKLIGIGITDPDLRIELVENITDLHPPQAVKVCSTYTKKS